MSNWEPHLQGAFCVSTGVALETARSSCDPAADRLAPQRSAPWIADRSGRERSTLGERKPRWEGAVLTGAKLPNRS
ncbi:unnamed protein product [Linum trigynum]|uniref:Uncharacterized protein n=1 Tax=Linum trigynum TaxID=586398 RepID=A0AAV2CMW5_9ROSI